MGLDGAAWALPVGLVFVAVYAGMVLGGWPGLRLDRAGVALVGAVAVLGMGALSPEAAVQAVDWPTLWLLFAFMVVSSQLRLAGFYGAVTRWVVDQPWPPAAGLAALTALAAVLSALFTNDVVCLALTPVVVALCRRRGLAPVPFLVGLACAANIGSAATLVGNPQNMLIGSVLSLSFAAYTREALWPVLWGWLVLVLWLTATPAARRRLLVPAAVQAASGPPPVVTEPPLDRRATAKGLLVVLAMGVALVASPLPPAVVALVGAGAVLLSRRWPSARVLAGVDGPLLLLFIGLFVVNRAFEHTGLAAQAVAALAAHGWPLTEPGVLAVTGLVLSNLVSNVPAVMLLLPHLNGMDPAHAGLVLGLVTTLAGNLLLVGSVANLIVADLARRDGVEVDWRAHARIGVPVTLLSLLGVAWALAG